MILRIHSKLVPSRHCRHRQSVSEVCARCQTSKCRIMSKIKVRNFKKLIKRVFRQFPVPFFTHNNFLFVLKKFDLNKYYTKKLLHFPVDDTLICIQFYMV